MSLCARCREDASTIIVRTESLCQECFKKYIKSKIVKRIEAFRTQFCDRRKQQKLLLPISFGTSSIVLLDVLSEYLEQQVQKSRREAFYIHVCHVLLPDQRDAHTCNALLKILRTKYPKHTYTLSKVDAAQDSSSPCNPSVESSIDLVKALSLTNSPTSRLDIEQTLLVKTVAETATSSDCEAVLWGDSTTKLAEKILAQTAKGHGSSLPWLVNDCKAPYGVNFAYPMRDLLQKEITAFADVTALPIHDLRDEEERKKKKPFLVNSKTSSIDELMHDYFRTVEINYPGIVANVVKTSSKLQPPSLYSENLQRCSICSMPLIGEVAPANVVEESDQTNRPADATSTACYGCARSLSGVV